MNQHLNMLSKSSVKKITSCENFNPIKYSVYKLFDPVISN